MFDHLGQQLCTYTKCSFEMRVLYDIIIDHEVFLHEVVFNRPIRGA